MQNPLPAVGGCTAAHTLLANCTVLQICHRASRRPQADPPDDLALRPAPGRSAGGQRCSRLRSIIWAAAQRQPHPPDRPMATLLSKQGPAACSGLPTSWGGRSQLVGAALRLPTPRRGAAAQWASPPPPLAATANRGGLASTSSQAPPLAALLRQPAGLRLGLPARRSRLQPCCASSESGSGGSASGGGSRESSSGSGAGTSSGTSSSSEPPAERPPQQPPKSSECLYALVLLSRAVRVDWRGCRRVVVGGSLLRHGWRAQEHLTPAAAARKNPAAHSLHGSPCTHDAACCRRNPAELSRAPIARNALSPRPSLPALLSCLQPAATPHPPPMPLGSPACFPS